MSFSKSDLIITLTGTIPIDIATHLVGEYQYIKTQFLLRRFKPSELDGARFSECVLRLIQFLDTGSYTPFGTHLTNTDGIINHALSNTSLPESIRFFIPRLSRVILDIRNKRNVAHVGGEVSPNFSDSLLVCHCADWIMTELVRIYHAGSIDHARKIVESINEIRIPIVAEIDGFLRVQDTGLDASLKVLVVLYYKQPEKVKDSDLIKWLRYKNTSRFKSQILVSLDAEALIHYENGSCNILPKGIHKVDTTVSLDMFR